MTKKTEQRPTDHDSPWKRALDAYFQEFLQLLFPKIYEQIDWQQGYSFLDKELQQISADAASGRRYADKLIKVFAQDGAETWVLIHVEIQGEPEDDFAQRMYTYQYRLRDRYQVDVVSLAVLADTNTRFRPSSFHYERWGCKLSFDFPTSKLIDWESEDKWAELEASDNVFALVVRAQIHAKRLKDGASRQQVKIILIRLLYERGYSRKQVVELFTIIDWIIQLPRELEEGFAETIYAIQEEKKMAYVNTIERVERRKAVKEGQVKGRKETALNMLQNLIQLKFGGLPNWAQQKLATASLEELNHWAMGILTAETLEDLLDTH